MSTFDDKPIHVPAVPDPWENAPTLHFSSTKPITRDDLKKAIARGPQPEPRPTYGWNTNEHA